MANDLTYGSRHGGSEAFPAMLTILVESVDGSAFDVPCGFFPSKVTVYSDETTDTIYEWNAAMGAAKHFEIGAAAGYLATAMVTAISDTSNGDGFNMAGLMASGGTAYMEVWR